jgi:hypothetical protein
MSVYLPKSVLDFVTFVAAFVAFKNLINILISRASSSNVLMMTPL